ncbi:hypothetical protein WISP_79602 [Willisornis vidua]|uniref:Uncharacterized protein n=1 Tax=Willisornis vidua TaxID=1566151 RepID=A0ABQ9DAX1_9PASS|nr:hypothetical protein WISP_79602 [Willisornis vidua]
MLDNPFNDKIGPDVQPEPPLPQLEAISSHPVTCLGEEPYPQLAIFSSLSFLNNFSSFGILIDVEDVDCDIVRVFTFLDERIPGVDIIVIEVVCHPKRKISHKEMRQVKIKKKEEIATTG